MFPISSGWYSSISPPNITFALIAKTVTYWLTWSKLINFQLHSFFLQLQLSHLWLLLCQYLLLLLAVAVDLEETTAWEAIRIYFLAWELDCQFFFSISHDTN